jgi:VIT1/CCC1 family predicted Fe2+/Mn2+ transporter
MQAEDGSVMVGVGANGNRVKLSPSTKYFKEVVYGGIDGIITTFAVVAGFSGAALANDSTLQLSFAIVLLFGLANLFADASSMGLGNFLSMRSEKDLYSAARRREERAIRKDANSEHVVTVAIMMEKGFSNADARTLADIYMKNEPYWVDFMMDHKLDLPDVRGANPACTGLATFLSFLFFGTIPLLPFVFMSAGEPSTAFYLSSFGTFAALTILGLIKWRIVAVKLRVALTEVWLVGGTAALIAYTVGTLFAI